MECNYHVVYLLAVCVSLCFIITYTLQIAVYLWNDLQLYLDHLPQHAICFCAPHTSPFLPDPALHRCQCRVPFVCRLQVLLTTRPAAMANNGSIFREYGLQYEDQIKVVMQNSSQPDDTVEGIWSYDETHKV